MIPPQFILRDKEKLKMKLDKAKLIICIILVLVLVSVSFGYTTLILWALDDMGKTDNTCGSVPYENIPMDEVQTLVQVGVVTEPSINIPVRSNTTSIPDSVRLEIKEARKIIDNVPDSVRLEMKRAKELEKQRRLDEEQNDIGVISCEEFDFFVRCIYAEAGGSTHKAKQLMADIILNMVDDSEYPNDIAGVIMNPGKFSVYPHMMNKIPHYTDMNKLERKAWDDCVDAVIEEMADRSNYDVMYCRSDRYHGFGHHLCHEGGIYFSTK